MCETCGCSDDAGIRLVVPAGSLLDESGSDHRHDHVHAAGHSHPHGSDHDHDHKHHDHKHDDHDPARGDAHLDRSPASPPATSRTIEIERNLLAKNDDLAARNRAWLAEHRMAALNLMSSPGSGKTTLLERTIRDHGTGRAVYVVEGDQETAFDAERIKATGAPVVQINTGAGCHLDADMLRHGLDMLDPSVGSLIFVENVGNLVCPALFDLGESAKVVIISVTEGDDKPLKYPHMFAAADLVVINKTDLLPYVDFDVDRCASDARSLNPGVTVLLVSARTGDGLSDWYQWLSTTAASPRSGPTATSETLDKGTAGVFIET